MQSNAFPDDFFSRCCSDNSRFGIDLTITVQLLVSIIAIIAAVTVCDVLHFQYRSSFVPFNISNILSVANRDKQNGTKEISVEKFKELQAISSNRRWWSTFSLDQFSYRQQQHKQQDVVIVQCNQHHRENHHQGIKQFKILYKTIANENNQLLNVVDYSFTNILNIRIAQTKKVLVENIIFVFLISLDMYS